MAALFLLTIQFSSADQLSGSDHADRLISTPAYDEFFGGNGEDVFVIEQLGTTPDLILDFEPDADMLELSTSFLSGKKLTVNDFELTTSGVLSVKLDRRTIPIVDLRLRDVTFEVDQRKGSYLLKFRRQLGRQPQSR